MNKFLIRYPEISIERWEHTTREETINEIKNSHSCLVIYENQEKVNSLIFSRLDEHMMINMIIMMSKHRELYEFLRLSVQCTQKFKSSYKEGIAITQQVGKFIEKHTNKDINRLHREEEERTNTPNRRIEKYFEELDRKTKNKKEGH